MRARRRERARGCAPGRCPCARRPWRAASWRCAGWTGVGGLAGWGEHAEGGGAAGGAGRTALSLCGVAELLEAASDLLGCPALAGRVVDVIRDELVPHGEAAERARGPRLDGLVLFETCGEGVSVSRHAPTGAGNVGGGPSTRAASR